MEIRRHSEFSPGFSLIELAVVVAIIVIAAAFVVPGLLRWQPSLKLKSAATDLRSNMQRARIEAIKRNAPVSIVFNVGGNSYVIQAGGLNITEPVRLQTYGHGTAFGMPAGGVRPGFDTGASVPPVSYAGNTLIFDAKGMNPVQGYVYLLNNDGAAFMIGTPVTTGIINMRKWFGGALWQ